MDDLRNLALFALRPFKSTLTVDEYEALLDNIESQLKQAYRLGQANV